MAVKNERNMKMRAYTIDNNGTVAINTKIVSAKCRTTRRAAALDIRLQATKESTETLRRIVSECAGTYLAQCAAKELSRRSA